MKTEQATWTIFGREVGIPGRSKVTLSYPELAQSTALFAQGRYSVEDVKPGENSTVSLTVSDDFAMILRVHVLSSQIRELERRSECM